MCERENEQGLTIDRCNLTLEDVGPMQLLLELRHPAQPPKSTLPVCSNPGNPQLLPREGWVSREPSRQGMFLDVCGYHHDDRKGTPGNKGNLGDCDGG